MISSKVGDWGKLGSILASLPRKVEVATKKAVMKEAHFLRTKIVEGIKEQAPGGQHFKPLAPETIAVRKFKGFNGTKALIRTGTLRNSIKVVDAQGTIFIGVHRNAKTKDGKNMVDIAAIHEFGAGPIVTKITPKMRAFLMAAFRQAGLKGPYGAGSGILITKIPARPFIGPVFEKYTGKQSVDRIQKELSRLLLGVLS